MRVGKLAYPLKNGCFFIQKREQKTEVGKLAYLLFTKYSKTSYNTKSNTKKNALNKGYFTILGIKLCH